MCVLASSSCELSPKTTKKKLGVWASQETSSNADEKVIFCCFWGIIAEYQDTPSIMTETIYIAAVIEMRVDVVYLKKKLFPIYL